MKCDHTAWWSGAAVLLIACCGAPAWAANECRVSVGVHAGSAVVRRDHTLTFVLSVGDVMARPIDGLNFVRNDGPHDVRFVFHRLPPLQLARGQSDPKLGHFAAGVALKSIECLPAKLAGASCSVPSVIVSSHDTPAGHRQDTRRGRHRRAADRIQPARRGPA